MCDGYEGYCKLLYSQENLARALHILGSEKQLSHQTANEKLVPLQIRVNPLMNNSTITSANQLGNCVRQIRTPSN